MLYIILYYLYFVMLYNNLYQFALNGAIHSIKCVQIYHHIQHVNIQPILHNIYIMSYKIAVNSAILGFLAVNCAVFVANTAASWSNCS